MKKSIVYIVVIGWLFSSVGLPEVFGKRNLKAFILLINSTATTSAQANFKPLMRLTSRLTFTNATGNPLWVFGDVSTDDAASGHPGDQPSIDNIDQFNFNSSNG